MHTVEMLREAVSLAKRAGYGVREEWLDGIGGGSCEVNGRKSIFIDLTLSPADQLDQILEALRHDPAVITRPMPHQLRHCLELRKSA